MVTAEEAQHKHPVATSAAARRTRPARSASDGRTPVAGAPGWSYLACRLLALLEDDERGELAGDRHGDGVAGTLALEDRLAVEVLRVQQPEAVAGLEERGHLDLHGLLPVPVV